MQRFVNRIASSGTADRLRRRVDGTVVHDALRRVGAVASIAAWATDRTLPPPPQYKIRELRRYARDFGLRHFVETGTFEGDTVAALRGRFDQVWTIELSPALHAAAAQRFADDPGVEVLLGDSGERLPDVLGELCMPALFWLDAHYSAGITALGSKESPIEQELRAILDHPTRGHVVLIDDAREFDGTRGYPMIDEVRSLVARSDDLTVEVRHDLIRIAPRR